MCLTFIRYPDYRVFSGGKIDLGVDTWFGLFNACSLKCRYVVW